MADGNPTGGGRMALLDLPPKHVTILRRTLSDSLAGVRDDLKAPERMPSPAKATREAAAYKRLLRALSYGWIKLPDEAAREAVAAIAAASDKQNEYEAVVAEHDALHGLLDRLTVE
jgi:hypothetical protein